MVDHEKLSKFLAYILRHNPEEFNLTLDAQGFTSVDSVWAAIQKRFPNGRYGWKDVLEIVKGDKTGKKRYEIKENRIRAMYGHNAAVTEITYRPFVPPSVLYHGTNQPALALIKLEGLKALGRQYVHLTTSADRAITVAKRRSNDIIVLEILSAEAHAAGVVFFRPEPEHFLAKAIPPEFIQFP
jgi:putative RNA 2'-phosphotransferase